jgi:chromosomal replication initiation ATPase DnaA
MNEHIIQSYIDNVTMHYGLTSEFIFSKGQKREKTEPRQMFFYLCHKKGIPIVSVRKILLDKYGFDMHHATILQSVRKIAENIEGDDDYTSLMNKLMNVSVNV